MLRRRRRRPVAGLSGLTTAEQAALRSTIEEHHRYNAGPSQCSSLLAQRIRAPAAVVWSVVHLFERPQTYKHFIRNCRVVDGVEERVGCLREVNVVSRLPASTSTERLDMLDEDRRIAGFSITGAEHRLRNYRSVTAVTEFGSGGGGGGEVWSVVLELYVVDVPEGNTEEVMQLFVNTVIKLNLQRLASITEAMAAAPPGTGGGEGGE